MRFKTDFSCSVEILVNQCEVFPQLMNYTPAWCLVLGRTQYIYPRVLLCDHNPCYAYFRRKKWFCLAIVTSLLDYVHFSARITGGLSSCAHFQIPKKKKENLFNTGLNFNSQKIKCTIFFAIHLLLLGHDSSLKIIFLSSVVFWIFICPGLNCYCVLSLK